MEWFDADGYLGARWLLQRGVALVYALAFVNILLQWRPLAGGRGLLPADAYVRGVDGFLPTLFRRGCPDGPAIALAWVGLAAAAALVAGLPQRGPWWMPLLGFLLLWVLYLSYVTVGGIWYAFGWESLLLEAGVLVAVLGSDEVAPSWLGILLVRWLLFRVELGAGLIKLRGDECWRQLTCLEYHHQTQPLPNRFSWRFHHLPRRVHRVEVAANHAAQLVVPFGLFLPQPVAGTAAVIIVATQGWLVVSGNFAWLNLLTMVLAASALPDAWLGWVPVVEPTADRQLAATMLVVGLTAVVVALSLRGPVPNLLARRGRQAMNASHDPLRLVNSYGAFGSVTRVRHELVVEATDAHDPNATDAVWREYRFRAKPGDPRRAPRQVAPYHLRLDWLLWFAAMDPTPTRHLWFRRLLERLAAADPLVLRLLAHDPLDGEPPTAVRVLRYRYRFSSPAERRETGDWWVRDRATTVAGPVPGRALPT